MVPEVGCKGFRVGGEGRAFSAILFSLFSESPQDSVPLCLVAIAVILVVAVLVFSKLSFFNLHLLSFISPYW